MVSWTEITGDKEVPYNNQACFYTLCGTGIVRATFPDKVRYPATVNTILQNKLETIQFYLDFLPIWLRGDRFSYEIVKKEDDIVQVVFVFDLRGLVKKSDILCHLTAFRYLDEFSTTVLEFDKYRGKGLIDEQLFIAFQDVHDRMTKMGCLYSGHGLRQIVTEGHGYNYGVLTARGGQYVSIAQFRAHLEDPKIKTVNEHFAVPPVVTVASLVKNAVDFVKKS